MGSIRLFLAFAVIVSHAVALEIDVMPGTVAVQAFFIISGFYMSLILNEKYEKSSLFTFYTNRFCRLFPTYLVVLFFSFAALWFFDAGIFTRLDKFRRVFSNGPVLALSYLWANLAVLGQDVLFLVGVNPENYAFFWDLHGNASLKAWSFILVPQAWSLSIEIYFYLLAPFILRRSHRWVAMVFFISLGLRVFIMSKGPEYDLFLRRFFPAELSLFLAGYFSYLLYSRVRNHHRERLMGLLCWAALILVLVFYNSISEKYALSLMAFTLVLSMPFIFNLAKESRIDRFLGNLSFPVYMVHFLIIELIDDFLHEYSLWMIIPPVLFIATALYYAIEVPIDRWRQQRVKRVVALSDQASENPWPGPMVVAKARIC